MEKEHSIN